MIGFLSTNQLVQRQVIRIEEKLVFKHSESLTAVAWSPNSKSIISAMCDEAGKGTLVVWNADSGNRDAAIQTPQIMIMSIAVRGDGKILAFGARDGSLGICSMEKYSILSISRDKLGMAYPLEFRADGNTLVSQDVGGCPVLWNANDPGDVKRFSDQPFKLDSSFSGYGISKDGKQIAMGEGNLSGVNAILVFDVATGRKKNMLAGPANVVSKITFNGDASFLAAGFLYGNRGQKMVRIWDMPSGKERDSLEHEGAVCALAFSPNGSTIVAGNNAGKITFWDLATKKSRVVAAHDGQVFALKFSPDGKRMISAGADAKVKLWEIK